MINDEKLKQILIQNKVLAEKKIEQYFIEAQEKQGSFLNYLIGNELVHPLEAYKALATYYQVPFINLKDKTLDPKLIKLLPESIAQAHHIAIFEQGKNKLKVATTDPHDLQTINFIKKKTSQELEVYLTDPESIKNLIKQYHSGLESELAALFPDKKELEEIQKIDGKAPAERLEKLAQDLPVIKIVETILDYAVYQEASDVHIEPTEKDVIIRLRIDGILKDIMTLPKSLHPAIVARIKVLAKLKIDEHRLPQDGRFKIEKKNQRIAIRVSIIPVFDGEKITLRLLDESNQFLTIEQLGLLPSQLEIIKKHIKKPNGIILVTGPTGCGKTTTLYTIINVLNNSKVNISTIEDPIEYRVERINQSQVNPKIGFTFATGLRSLLRQDPNIIMVGEIRDNETAEIAMHAALTGHLVLATLHTNNAVGALPRLLEMDIPPFLIASTVNLIIAQRLVRKICPHCIESYTLSKQQIQEIEKSFKIENILKTLEKHGEIESPQSPLEETSFYKGTGCPKCGGEGLKGRTGIYELLEVTPKISDLILKKAPLSQLEKAAKEQGMISLWQDGFIKAKRGITVISEILRVTKEE